MRDLQRIARHTRGEHQLSDVINEAWMLGESLPLDAGTSDKFSNPAFQDMLLRHLYQSLVRYTEQNIRLAVRIDHAPGGADSPDAAHPLMNTLVSDGGRDPLAELIEREAALLDEKEPDVCHSLASAYVCLLRRFDNSMRAVATTC
jgi:hypothetical protein